MAEKMTKAETPTVEITTVKRVYLKDKRFWKSGYHNALIAPPGLPPEQGKDQIPISVPFIMGVARNVPKNIFDALVAYGIATTEKPRLHPERDEDDD